MNEWLSWQETLHPQEIELGLARIRPVAERLELLKADARVVTVAGTNGKGSSIAILESIARESGLRVAVYTSPHLLRYNERIRIEGVEASDEQICEAFEQIDRARGDISLTYFEFGTLAALYLFRQQPLDLWILEVGLGGRLDAVNLIDADVALLTTVDLDHQAWLGETREEIGLEKAGIFRSAQPAVIGEDNPPQSVIAHAAGIGAKMSRFGKHFHYRQKEEEWQWQGSGEASLQGLPMPALSGAIQLQNSAAVLEVLNQLECLDGEAVKRGLRQVTLPGRFQTIATAPQLIVDVSHNPQAAQVLAQNLADTRGEGETIAVVGMLRDKEIGQVIERLAPEVDRWIAVGLEGPRGVAAEEMAATVTAVAGKATCCSGPVEGVQLARQHASVKDRILLFGSFYTVAALLEAP